MGKIRIQIANRQNKLDVDRGALREVLKPLLAESVLSAWLSVAVVDDDEITRLNCRFLGRDRSTDVLAFPYAGGRDCLEGEVVVNAEEALRQAEGRSHGPQDELLLYAVHGLLHLLGYDDADARQRKAMHERELAHLLSCGRALDS